MFRFTGINVEIQGESEHCIKSVRIWSFFGPYFPAFRLNTERDSVCLRSQSECGKIRPRKTPNIDTFHSVESVTEKIITD